MSQITVGINGYGIIGKRIADAVQRQPGMALVGVADVAADYRTRTAMTLGIPMYAAIPDARTILSAYGVALVGTLDDLLDQIDMVVDCTPKRIAATNKAAYDAAAVKSIFQGGESHTHG